MASHSTHVLHWSTLTRQNCSMDLREDTLCSESMITKGISAVAGSTGGQDKGVPPILIIDSIFRPFYGSEHRTVRIPIYGQPQFFHSFHSSFSSARKAHHSPSGHHGEEALRPGNISRNSCVVTSNRLALICKDHRNGCMTGPSRP